MDFRNISLDHWPAVPVQNEAFLTGLKHLAQLGRVPEGLVPRPHPLPVYHVELADIVEFSNTGTLPELLVRWRYYAGGDDQEQTASADLDLADAPQVVCLSYGPSVWNAIHAAEALLGLTQIQGLFEPRLLEVPSLLTQAFWLKPKMMAGGDAAGWVVPYHTLVKGLNPAIPYPLKDFIAALYPLAVKSLAGPALNGKTK